MTDPHHLAIPPDDKHNQRLVDNVHPKDWVNPVPADMYNLVVIGAGPAGLVAAAGAAGLGAKVAIIEKHLIGGDCLNVGCVPSKCIIRSSRSAAEMKNSVDLGMMTASDGPKFASVMERMRRIRADISAHDAATRFREQGIDVFLGAGKFQDNSTVVVNDTNLHFKKAVIATGARAAAIDIPGLDEADYLTNETIFNLTELPDHLVVLGGGPIGCELAQAFRRLGSRVTIIARSRLLSREDPDASALLARILDEEGVATILNASVRRVEKTRTSYELAVDTGQGETKVEASHILVGVGRAPNVEGLGLESAGIEYDAKRGVHVDDQLRTTNRHIFAAGDVCMKHKFTHAADAAARIVIQNALFGGRKKLSAITMPWCTFTDPEIAHVGVYGHLVDQDTIDTYHVQLEEIDRALADGETAGFVKIHTAKGSDRILGATIVASHAGEMIGEISVAMAAKLGLGGIANVIHPYPTQAEAIKRAADAYSRTRLTPTVQKSLAGWLKFKRR